MPIKSGTNRDLFPGHGAGKGDVERSLSWRNSLDDIAFPPSEGFVRVAVNRIRKTYGKGAGGQGRFGVPVGTKRSPIEAAASGLDPAEPSEGTVPTVPPENDCCSSGCTCER